MNIFRKSYSVDTFNSNFFYDFDSLGFDNIDGTKFDVTDTDMNAKQISMKWGEDLPNTNHFYLTKPTMSRTFGSNTESDSYIFLTPGYAANILFIPLINDGFILLNYRSNNYSTPLGGIVPTLPILTYHTIMDYDANAKLNSIIGFRTSIYQDNPFSYIYTATDGNVSRVIGPKLSLRNDIIIDPVPFVDNVSKEYSAYNANVCTLAKMPYNENYIDNVYLCMTSPFEDGVEGKVFSFGGRTFIGMYNNLVFELPSN